MAKGNRCVKVVEWSDEDRCFVGGRPRLMHGGAQGDDATKVLVELCELVEDAIEAPQEAGTPGPQPLALHETAAIPWRSA